MKDFLLIIACFPLLVYGQLSVGSDQTICLGEEFQVIAALSGAGTSGCNGSIDSLASDIGPSNGSSGAMFNIINTSTTDLTITGFSQGTYSYSGSINMDIWYYPGDYLPVMSSTVGWTQIATNVATNLPVGASVTAPLYTPVIPITSVIIPAGATYGFYIGGSATVSYATAPAGTVSGISSWGSNSVFTITAGHGGPFPSPTFTPRGPLIKVYYGGGASWYDVNTGQLLGSGDTLSYTPSQTTDIAAIFDCNGQTYADTMYVEVLDADLSTTGVSLCNGPVILSAPSSFSSFLWSTGNSSSNLLTVNTAGDYSVVSTTTNGISCPSDTITVYSGNIPISLSTPDSVFICAGDTVFIDGPLGFVQYNWNTGATASSISTMSPGNYSLSVVDGNGCPGTSNVTSVSMSPTSITATTTGLSLCNGPVTLDAGSGMVASYQWYNNGIVMFGATNQTLLVANAGNFYVEVTYPTGCTATSNILSILAGSSQFTFPIDSVGSGSLCLPNGEVILDAGSYAQYVWSPGGQTTQQISVTVEGSYSVSVIDANGCQGISAAPFVVSNIVTTSPISGPTAPTQFQTVTYSVLPTAGSTYSWMLSGGSIVSGQGTNSIDVIWNSSGMFSFSVIETDMNGCVGEEVSTIVNVIVSSLYDLHESERNLLRVTDILGREIKEGDQPFFYIYDDGTVEKRIVID